MRTEDLKYVVVESFLVEEDVMFLLRLVGELSHKVVGVDAPQDLPGADSIASWPSHLADGS